MRKNNRHRSYLAVTFVTLLLGATAFAQSRDLEQVRARAEECGKAYVSSDFNKLADLTYPKVVLMMGGKSKMVAFLEAGQKEMAAQGFEVISYDVGAPKEIVRTRTKLISIVPTVLKAKVKEGIVSQRSYLLGVSSIRVKGWTFIDGSSLDKSKLRAVIPDAASKVVLPKHEEPVLEKTL